MSAIALGLAERMPGSPKTEDGYVMPLACWFHLVPATAGVEYVAVTNHGVYQVNPLGQVHDFFACLYQRRAVDTHAEALAHIGAGYGVAR